MSQTRNGNQNETTGFSSHFAIRLFTPARYRFCCVLCIEIVKNENRKIHFQLDNKFLFCVLMLWATKATYKTRFHSVIYSLFFYCRSTSLCLVCCAVEYRNQKNYFPSISRRSTQTRSERDNESKNEIFMRQKKFYKWENISRCVFGIRNV